MSNHASYLYGLRVLSHCGSGAYGDVYYCQDASGKRVALKVISKGKIGSGWERELKGITNYRRLAEDSPLLLNIFHVGEDDTSLYYTMEPADNAGTEENYTPDTLAARLAHGPLPPEKLLPTLKRLLECITALHQAGFAHRDIKPENILFVNGEPKLADLGLLSPLSGTLTQLAGTLDFLPPEERTGEGSGDSHETRQRNDLYAFGKIIYCCVSGRSAGDFPTLPPDLPLTVANKYFFRLALRLCEREPSLRLHRMDILQREFDQAEKTIRRGETMKDKARYFGKQVVLCVQSFGWRCFQFLQRHYAVTAVGLFVLVSGAGFLVRYFHDRPDQASLELAKALLESKENADADTTRSFTFYQGVYSLNIPTGWQCFGREVLYEMLGGPIKKIQYTYGVVIPDDRGNGNLSPHFEINVLPWRKEKVEQCSDSELSDYLSKYIGGSETVKGLSLKRYHYPRLNLDTVMFVGDHRPAHVIAAYLFPQEDHSLLLTGFILSESYEEDMRDFLEMMDSLVYRIPQKEHRSDEDRVLETRIVR